MQGSRQNTNVPLFLPLQSVLNSRQPQIPQPALEPPQRQPEPQKRQEENEALERILSARETYNKLSLREFARLLYDRDIYKSRDRKSGEPKIIDSGTLGRWLAQAGMS